MTEEIITPTLLLDEKKCRRNIRGMAEKARKNGLIFRPHFKTHQSAEIADWFRNEGVRAITVSSVAMADYFAINGWNDITIAFPVNIREMDMINRLAKKISLNVLVNSTDSAQFLNNNLTSAAGFFIEIDCGYPRSGVPFQDTETIRQILDKIQHQVLIFRGFLSHSGNTYNAGSEAEIKTIHRQTTARLQNVRKEFTSLFPSLILSLGDTPACSICDDFSGLDEIRPGNFVFYDLMQFYLGACQYQDIAVCLACPVVDVYPQRNEAVVYAGAVHLSKEKVKDENGQIIYGHIVALEENGWGNGIKGSYVKSLSQEHGIIKFSDEGKRFFRTGEIIGVIPVHSCLTAAAMRRMITLEGKRITMMP